MGGSVHNRKVFQVSILGIVCGKRCIHSYCVRVKCIMSTRRLRISAGDAPFPVARKVPQNPALGGPHSAAYKSGSGAKSSKS